MKGLIDIEQLNYSEKLQLLDQLWEDIRSSDKFESPKWHLDILKEREEKYSAGEEELIDWETFKKSMDL
ncbi:MAG: addiction module protein [Balneolaceae bacterium]|nr:addiction module protein [Balneolaceae bacterium]